MLNILTALYINIHIYIQNDVIIKYAVIIITDLAKKLISVHSWYFVSVRMK